MGVCHCLPMLREPEITGVNLASSSFCAILCWVFGLISWPGRMSLDFYLHLVLLCHPVKVQSAASSHAGYMLKDPVGRDW